MAFTRNTTSQLLHSLEARSGVPLHKVEKAVQPEERNTQPAPERPTTPTTSQPEFSFRKVDGSWLVRVWDGPDVQPGQQVEITTKAGKTSTVTLGDLHSEDRKARLFHVARDEKQEQAPRQENPEPEAGMYRLDDASQTIVRVYLGQKSGKMLAKQLVNGVDGSHEYKYMGLAKRFVKPTTRKLTLAEAKEFGRMTGHCCVCARRLDVPESVEAGIGPVCSSRLEA